ncbi:MAG: hypothetical protein AAF478_10770 [Pseudomonadota bacterium]
MLRMIDDFELRALRSEALAREREKWFIAARNRKERKEIRGEAAEQDIFDMAAAAIVADQIEVQEFKAELETYDALTIEAIKENQAILESLYRKRDEMLANAYKLEDGTIVFRSEDNARVFDSEGNPVPEEVVHPDEIGDHHPKAEPYFEIRLGIDKHEVIEENLFDYQEKLDEARKHLDSGDLTQEEFENIRGDIKNNMPIEVRRKLPVYDPSKEIDMTSDFAATAAIEQATKLSPEDLAIDPSLVPG